MSMQLLIGPYRATFVIPLALVVFTGVSSTARAAGEGVAPPQVVAAWETGTWGGYGAVFPFTGFKDEPSYGDPAVRATYLVPFTPEYAAKWQRIRQEAFKGRNVLDIGNRCLPFGVPFISYFGEMQILFAPDRVVMTGGWAFGVRLIYTDGKVRPLPAPAYNGDSVGHWEGNTLVIKTTDLVENTFLEVGMPHSDAMQVSERWNYDGPDRILTDVTVDDPKAFTRPLHHQFIWTHDPNARLYEDTCQENNRDPQVNGATTLLGPDGRPLTTPVNAPNP